MQPKYLVLEQTFFFLSYINSISLSLLMLWLIYLPPSGSQMEPGAVQGGTHATSPTCMNSITWIGDAVGMLQLLQPLWELSSFKLLLIISVLQSGRRSRAKLQETEL